MSKLDAKDAVLKYLTLQNRPYSVNDVTQNMNKEFGKTAIQKALDELASSGQIKEKVYGKQKVYAPLQEDCDQTDMDQVLGQLDVLIKDTSVDLARAEQELKTVESELKLLANQSSTEDAIKLAKMLTEDVSKLQDKLDSLQKTTSKIDPLEKKKFETECDKFSIEYRKRKRICMDIANSILENYPKSKKMFFEEVGIETDEDVVR